MSSAERPYPKNVPGDFYVVDGCCMSCGIPDVTAPTLFAWDDEVPSFSHCFVARQPTTPQEVENMLEAMTSSEVDCIRYRGRAPNIVRSVVEYGQSHLLDLPPPPNLREVIRNHASFDLAAEFGGPPTVKEVAVSLEVYLHGISNSPHAKYKIIGVRMRAGMASLAYAWAEGELHPIEVLRPQKANVSCLVRHSPVVLQGTRSVSRIINGWLRSGSFQNIRWYSEEEWKDGSAGQDTPF